MTSQLHNITTTHTQTRHETNTSARMSKDSSTPYSYHNQSHPLQYMLDHALPYIRANEMQMVDAFCKSEEFQTKSTLSWNHIYEAIHTCIDNLPREEFIKDCREFVTDANILVRDNLKVYNQDKYANYQIYTHALLLAHTADELICKLIRGIQAERIGACMPNFAAFLYKFKVKVTAWRKIEKQQTVYFNVLHIRARRFQLAHAKNERDAAVIETNIRSLTSIIVRKLPESDPLIASMRETPATQAEYDAILEHITQNEPISLQPNHNLNF